MNVSKKITIDLNNPRKNVVHLGQGDNQHQIVLTLLKDGMPFDVSEGIGTATLVAGVQYIKANGVPGYYDWTSTDMAAVVLVTGTTNVWNVLIDEHATDVAGFAEIFVKFSLASGETLYSFPITLDVIRTSGGTTDPDKPYYHSTSFLLAGAQAAKTPAMTFPVGVDGDGKLWAEGGWSAEAKEALIACFEQVAWKTTYGQTYLSALETALYPEVHLASITAAYDQDRPIYTNGSLDEVKLDLVVTANYSDGSSATIDNYTLSGTLHEGTSTITVSYAGKTDTISVVCTVNGWLYHFEQSTASAGTKDFGWSGSPEYHTGHNGEGYSYHNGDEIVESTSFTPPDLSGDFTMAWWQKCITQNKKGQGLSPFKVGTTSGAMIATGCGSPANVKSGWSVSRDTSLAKTTEGIRVFWSSEKFQIRCVTSALNYGANYNATPPSGFDATAWHHYAITRKDNVLRLFVDGEMIFSAEVTLALFFNTQVAFGAYYANAGDTSAIAGSYLCDYDDLFIAEWCKWDSNFDASAIQY